MPSPTAHPVEPVGVSVVIPMYREAARIVATLDDAVTLLSVAEHTSEIVLVDDGSPDDTVDHVAKYLTDEPNGPLASVRLVRHHRNRGKGAAVRTGLAAATGRWHLIMDADNAATIRELARLRAAVAPGIGLIAGSRVAEGSRVEAIAGRKLAGSVFKLALRGLGLDLVDDTQCGFKLYRADVAEQVVALGREDGYAFDLEHLLIARAAGLEIREVGIAWTHQTGGQVNPVVDGLKMLRRAAGIRARRREIEQSVSVLPPEMAAPNPDPVPEIPVVVTRPGVMPAPQGGAARPGASLP